MASKKDNKDESESKVDRSDSVRHASDDARAEAIKKMKEAQEASKKKEVAEAKEEPDETKDDASLEDGEGHESAVKVEEADAEDRDIEPLTDEETGNRLLKQVKIYSPFKTYFDKEALSVSAVNGTGPFDVLPGHKNFLSLLQPCEVLVRVKAGDERFKIERGILHVHRDYVKIFLDV